jgi:Flp pilus assembly protein TadG
MPTARLKRLRKLAADERAATAVEFALLVAPLVGLILASLQLSIIFFAGQTLQSIATLTGRQLMTGADQQAGLTQAQFQTAVTTACTNAGAPLSCSNIMVDVESATSYSTLNTAPLVPTYNAAGQVTNTFAYSPGGPGDIVIVRLMYNWPVIGSPLLPGLANQPNGDRLLVATSVLKIEPY